GAGVGGGGNPSGWDSSRRKPPRAAPPMPPPPPPQKPTMVLHTAGATQSALVLHCTHWLVALQNGRLNPPSAPVGAQCVSVRHSTQICAVVLQYGFCEAPPSEQLASVVQVETQALPADQIMPP